jgi:hypothetical protein
MSDVVHRTTACNSPVYHFDLDCDLIQSDTEYTTYRLEIARAWNTMRPCKECGSDSE